MSEEDHRPKGDAGGEAPTDKPGGRKAASGGTQPDRLDLRKIVPAGKETDGDNGHPASAGILSSFAKRKGRKKERPAGAAPGEEAVAASEPAAAEAVEQKGTLGAAECDGAAQDGIVEAASEESRRESGTGTDGKGRYESEAGGARRAGSVDGGGAESGGEKGSAPDGTGTKVAADPDTGIETEEDGEKTGGSDAVKADVNAESAGGVVGVEGTEVSDAENADAAVGESASVGAEPGRPGGPRRKRTKLSPEEAAKAHRGVEALLFATPEPLTAAQIGRATGLSADEVRSVISELQNAYDRERRAFEVVSVAGGYRLMTRSDMAPFLQRLRRHREASKMTQAAVETLAVIAYRQPITRAEIESVRGVNCGEILRGLLERKLIRIMGRADSLGSPLLYATSDEFLKHFGLASLQDLPKAGELGGSADRRDEPIERREGPADQQEGPDRRQEDGTEGRNDPALQREVSAERREGSIVPRQDSPPENVPDGHVEHMEDGDLVGRQDGSAERQDEGAECRGGQGERQDITERKEGGAELRNEAADRKDKPFEKQDGVSGRHCAPAARQETPAEQQEERQAQQQTERRNESAERRDEFPDCKTSLRDGEFQV